VLYEHNSCSLRNTYPTKNIYDDLRSGERVDQEIDPSQTIR